MNAQVLYGINNLKYEESYELPVLKDDEVLLKVKACGICGSDVDRVLVNGTYHFPTIIGHEFSGEVVKVHNEKNSHMLGEKFSVFPLIPCKKCSSCKKGNFQLCENYNYLGSRCDGGFAEYVAVPTWNLLKIPESISFEEAAMLEPAAVALHCLKLSGDLSGKTVLITGAGTISSILVQIAYARGAKNVILLARNKSKMEYIKSKCPNAKIVYSEQDNLSEEIFQVSGYWPEIVVEGTGNQSMLTKVIQLVERQGTIVVLGNPSDDVKLEKKIFWQILRKELTLKGTWNSSYGFEGKNDWKEVFELILSKDLNLKDLITHKLQLKDLMNGIRIMKEKSEISNKIMVVYDEK